MSEYIKQLDAARLRFGEQPIRRVLLPTDFSSTSLRPLGLAVEVAAAAGAELHILHAEDPVVGLPEGARFPTDEEVRAATWGASPATLHQWAAGSVSELEVRWETRVAIDPAAAILEYAQEESVDLMVMGTAGRKGLVRAFLGSVAERVLIQSPCPVVTLGADAPEKYAAEKTTILVPIDFSEVSLAGLAHAETLCEQLQGALCLVHAISPAPMPAVYGDFATTVWEYEDVGERVENHLRRIAEKVSPRVKTSVAVRRGSAARCVIEAAEECGADLIVIGSRGLTGFSRVLLGSVAQRVLRAAPVPVMIFKDRIEQEDEGEQPTAVA